MIQAIRDMRLSFKYNLDYWPVVAFSCICFTLIYTVVSPYISTRASKNYAKLLHNHKIEWDVRFTSTVFSTLVGALCVYILVVDHALAASPLIYDSMLVNTNIAIVMGYVISDLGIILSNYRIIGDAFTVIHHLMALYGYSNSLTYSVMPYFANLRLIVELSTPLVNMRWFLYANGHKKDSLCFFLNGITMTLMFFAVRIASIPVYWYKIYTVLDSPNWIKMRSFRYVMVVTCATLDVINIYWFHKMFKGALIVWSSNQHQLEALQSYRTHIAHKLTNNVMYQSTITGWNRINPTRYIGQIYVNAHLARLYKAKHDDDDHHHHHHHHVGHESLNDDHHLYK